jgi:hypothetical protein
MCARSARRLLPLLFALGVALSPGLSFAQAASEDNPLLGTWRLLVEKSRYNPGPPPQRQTRTYEAAPQGVKTTIRTVDADGESTVVEYTANYDSIEYHVYGSATTSGIALTKVDAYTAEATLSHAGRVVGHATRVVSKDGKTMTITFRDKEGVVHNVAAYEREKD